MFRYKLVVYHENQPWIPEVSRLLDLPFFHVFSTDSSILLQQQLQSNDVDIIITNFQSRMLALMNDSGNSLGFFEDTLWKTLHDMDLHHKVVLMCSLQDVDIAADLVQQGMAADYVVVDPMIDPNRPVITVMKALESNSLRELVATHLMDNNRLPLHPVESLEILKTTEFGPGSSEEKAPEKDSWQLDAPASPGNTEENQADKQYQNALSGDFLSMLDSDDDNTVGLDGLMNQLGGSGESEKGKLLARSITVENEVDIKPLGKKVLLAPDELNEIPIDADFPLPAKQAHQGRDVTRRGAWTNLQKSKEPILLVEPPGSSIGQILTTLKRANLKARVVNSAADALAALNKELFELMLISTELPDQKGVGFVHRIRLKGPQSDINVIMLSDRARHEDVLKSVKVGADYFIIKPFDPDRFLKYIAQHMPMSKS